TRAVDPKTPAPDDRRAPRGRPRRRGGADRQRAGRALRAQRRHRPRRPPSCRGGSPGTVTLRLPGGSPAPRDGARAVGYATGERRAVEPGDAAASRARRDAVRPPRLWERRWRAGVLAPARARRAPRRGGDALARDGWLDPGAHRARRA